MGSGLFVTLLGAPFSTVVVLLTELLDPAAGLQDHHFRDGDYHSEEIRVLEALQREEPVILRAMQPGPGPP